MAAAIPVNSSQSWIVAVPPETIPGDGFKLVRRRGDDEATEVFWRVVEESREHLARWIPWAIPTTKEDAKTYLQTKTDEWETMASFQFFLVLPSDDKEDAAFLPSANGIVAGCISLINRCGPGATEIGYWIAEKHTRKGLTKRASSLLTDFALTTMGASRVVVIHDKAIEASSGGVPRSLGFDRAEEYPQTGREPLPGEAGVLVRWVKLKP